MTHSNECVYYENMGKMNILKSGYEGKTGQTYGIKKGSQYYIKAVPFSHTPHNKKQNLAKLAFTRLNRIASVIAKTMWQYLQLSDKEMYRNNAVAQFLKASLINNEFYIENLAECIESTGELQLYSGTFNSQTYNFEYIIENTSHTENLKEEKVFLAIVTNECVVKAKSLGSGRYILLSSIFNYIDFVYYQVLAFKSVPHGKKRILTGLFVSEKIYVIIVNGIFYMSRWQWELVPYVKEEILYIPSKAEIDETGTLVIL